MRKRIMKAFVTAGMIVSMAAFVPTHVMAAEKFDPAFYAATYPDVVAVLGTDVNALYNHYLSYGQKEGRLPYAGATGGVAVEGIADTTVTETASTATGIVPIDQLANYKSLKKKMTDEEFQAAYNEALKIVQPLVGLNSETQFNSITSSLRARFDSSMTYSTSAPHYNDAYGYLILGSASCAGCTRTTGLCLNMLGYTYEHVNENQWAHQWCRIDVGGGVFWICDPYGLYSGPEPGPYQHPYL